MRFRSFKDLRRFAERIRSRVPRVIPTNSKSVSTYTGTDAYGNYFRAPRVAHPKFSGKPEYADLKYTPTPNPNVKPNEYMSEPFFDKISDKGWQSSKNVLKRMKRLGDGGFVRPIEIANARAGDPEYARKAYQSIMGHLQDPKNGWTINKALTAENGGHLTWTHPKLPNTVVPSALWGSMNYSVPVVLTKGQNSYSRSLLVGLDRYNARDKALPNMYVKSRHPNVDYRIKRAEVRDDAYKYNNIPGARLDYNMLGNTDDFVRNAHRLNATIPDNTLKRYSNADTLSHELMHPAYDNFIHMGGFPSHPTSIGRDAGNGWVRYYSSDPDHIPVFLAQFKQQMYNNTKGKVLMSKPEKFDDYVQYGLEHIEDFGPESRRLLHSIQQLKNVASNPYNSDDVRQAAQYAMDQYKNMVPFVFGGAAIPATALMQNNQDEDIRNIHNGQR